MAKGAFVGVGGVARKVVQPYIGVGGVARKVVAAYVGENGIARQWWPSETSRYGILLNWATFVVHTDDEGQTYTTSLSNTDGGVSGMDVSYGAGGYNLVKAGSNILTVRRLGIVPPTTPTIASTSDGGITWTYPTLPALPLGLSLYPRLACIGNTIITSAQPNGGSGPGATMPAYYLYSSDAGSTWSLLPAPTAANAAAYITVYAVNGLFVMMRHIEYSIPQSTYYTSTDGVSWTARTLPTTMLDPTFHVANDDSTLFVITSILQLPDTLNAHFHYTTDGINWAPFSGPALPSDSTAYSTLMSAVRYLSRQPDGYLYSVVDSSGTNMALRLFRFNAGVFTVTATANNAIFLGSPYMPVPNSAGMFTRKLQITGNTFIDQVGTLDGNAYWEPNSSSQWRDGFSSFIIL